MIARSTTLTQPIPFASGLNGPKPAARPFADPLFDQRQAAARSWQATPSLMAPPAPTLWAQASKERSSANDAPAASRPKPSDPGQASRPAWPGSTGRAARQALARYDGPHSLSIRSAASGRHYRFEHQGMTQVIDAMDIALMRRIEDITLL